MMNNLKFEFEKLSKEKQEATIEVFCKRWGLKKRIFFKYLNGYNEYSDIYLWLCWQIYDLVKIEQNRFLFEDTDDDFFEDY
jgi:hypothetical protein